MLAQDDGHVLPAREDRARRPAGPEGQRLHGRDGRQSRVPVRTRHLRRPARARGDLPDLLAVVGRDLPSAVEEAQVSAVRVAPRGDREHRWRGNLHAAHQRVPVEPPGAKAVVEAGAPAQRPVEERLLGRHAGRDIHPASGRVPVACFGDHDGARLAAIGHRVVEDAVAVDVRVQALLGEVELADGSPGVEVDRLDPFLHVGDEDIRRPLVGVDVGGVLVPAAALHRRLSELPHGRRDRVAVVLACGVLAHSAAVLLLSELALGPDLAELLLPGPFAVLVLGEMEELKARVGEAVPPVRHRPEDRLPVVPAGCLSVVPDVEALRIEPVVVLRDQRLRELGSVPVEVCGLVAPALDPRAALESIVGEVPRGVHARLEHLVEVLAAFGPAVPPLALLKLKLLLEDVLVVRPVASREVAVLGTAPDDHHPAVALDHGVVGDVDGDLADLRVMRHLLADARLPHQPQVVVEAEDVPARGHHHHHLLPEGADKLHRLWVEVSSRHCNCTAAS
mmetsp:Transcript_21460/g.51196  ORF Transcript_21460/g.51196 Transcript_21460/m.51196 type:complete len:507 (+) Transcript_21460:482-2002(+)